MTAETSNLLNPEPRLCVQRRGQSGTSQREAAHAPLSFSCFSVEFLGGSGLRVRGFVEFGVWGHSIESLALRGFRPCDCAKLKTQCLYRACRSCWPDYSSFCLADKPPASQRIRHFWVTKLCAKNFQKWFQAVGGIFWPRTRNQGCAHAVVKASLDSFQRMQPGTKQRKTWVVRGRWPRLGLWIFSFSR